MPLKIKNRKIIKQGESHFFYIPKAYITNGQIDLNREYTITLVVQKNESSNQEKQSLEV